MAVKLGVFRPFGLSALRVRHVSALGPNPREALRNPGALWSTYSKVASKIPNSWMKRAAPDEITTATPRQPPDRWPYTKLMVANRR